MIFLNLRNGWKTPDSPRSIEGRFHSFNRVRDWDPKGSSCHNLFWYRWPEQIPGSTIQRDTPPFPYNMEYFIDGKPRLLSKFASPRHSLGLVPRSIEVRFHSFNRVQDWDLKGSSCRKLFCYRWPEQIPGSTSHRDNPTFPYYMIILIDGKPWLLSKFAWPSHSSDLAPRSIEVRFHSFNWVCDWELKGSSPCNSSWYQSSKQIPGLIVHQGNPRFPLIKYISLTKELLGSSASPH